MCCCQLRCYLITVTIACFLVSLATSVPRDKCNMWEKQKGMIFFFDIKLLIYMSFLCRFASVCKTFYFGKYNIGAYHWMFKVFKLDQSVLNETVWWSNIIGHSTKSNNFWSQSNFQFSYRSKWNSHKENYYRTKPNFLIPNSWWQVCGFNSRFFYYFQIWSQF